MRAQIQTAITTGPLRGLSMDTLSQSLMGAQTQFSVLSGATPEARQENLNRQLELASFARSTFQDPAEVMRVGGMLSQQLARAGRMPALMDFAFSENPCCPAADDTVKFARALRTNPAELFIRHRQNLRELLKPKSMVILHANDIYPTNADGSMAFKQNSDLFYLTGVDQEETTWS